MTWMLKLCCLVAAFVVNISAACVNPTPLDLSQPLLIGSSLNTSLVAGISPGDSNQTSYTSLIDDFITVKSYENNLYKNEHIKKLTWNLECDGDGYLLRHNYFDKICLQMIDPEKYPWRTFVRLADCNNTLADNDILRFNFREYDSETGLAQLQMVPKAVSDLPSLAAGRCLTIADCYVDDRQNCNPEPLPNNVEASRSQMFTMINCDKNEDRRGQLFVVGSLPEHHIPTISPTKYPTQSPTMFPTVSPTPSVQEEVTLSPSLSPTSSPSASPTSFPTVSPTKASSDDDLVDDGLSGDKNPANDDEDPKQGLDGGIIALIIILIILLLLLVAYFAKKKQNQKKQPGEAESGPTPEANSLNKV